ncbi:hypothetical protein Daus18300_001023 [Diaporthe australafricana]|uniref:2EXR domain-containing protein n=1 Tax=Diaporthe australafricana TaxID=127596 RepID=A0ABR3Y072_9PEZI
MASVMLSDVRSTLQGSLQTNGDTSKRIETIPFMNLPPEIRIMIWQASMPDSPCSFDLRILRERSRGGRACALQPTEATVYHRKFTAVLSATCREARREVVLKYPDLLPLCKSQNMRFSYVKDTVLVDNITQWYGYYKVLPKIDSVYERFARGLRFSQGWNTQIQNIALKDDMAMRSAWDVLEFEDKADYKKSAESRLAFLSLFPRLKHHSLHYSAFYDPGHFSFESPRHDERGRWERIYGKEDYTSFEENGIPCGVYDLKHGLEIYPPGSFGEEKVRSLLSHQEAWKKALDDVLQRILQPTSAYSSKFRASVARIRDLSYSAMISLEG